MADCTGCGRAGEPYTYRGIEFDGLCAWRGDKLCPPCRDARLALLGEAAMRAPITPRVRDGYGPPPGEVAEIKLPICPTCWHDTGRHCGPGAHLEDDEWSVCFGRGHHCEHCPGGRCQVMVPVMGPEDTPLIMTPAHAAGYRRENHEAAARPARRRAPRAARSPRH